MCGTGRRIGNTPKKRTRGIKRVCAPPAHSGLWVC
nr:MAG TPA: hypothetical protein [Caudoviricetes sp.]